MDQLCSSFLNWIFNPPTLCHFSSIFVSSLELIGHPLKRIPFTRNKKSERIKKIKFPHRCKCLVYYLKNNYRLLFPTFHFALLSISSSFVPFPIRSFMRYSFDNIFKSRREEARIKANINQFSVSSIRLLFLLERSLALAASDNFLPSAFHHRRCFTIYSGVSDSASLFISS